MKPLSRINNLVILFALALSWFKAVKTKHFLMYKPSFESRDETSSTSA